MSPSQLSVRHLVCTAYLSDCLFHCSGDLLMALAWSLPTAFDTPVTYFYVSYFLVLLIHRQYRDDENCEKKYVISTRSIFNVSFNLLGTARTGTSTSNLSATESSPTFTKIHPPILSNCTWTISGLILTFHITFSYLLLAMYVVNDASSNNNPTISDLTRPTSPGKSLKCWRPTKPW